MYKDLEEQVTEPEIERIQNRVDNTEKKLNYFNKKSWHTEVSTRKLEANWK